MNFIINGKLFVEYIKYIIIIVLSNGLLEPLLYKSFKP